MDAKYLAEIKARCDAATPGLWKVGDGSVELYFQGENSVVAESRVIAERAVYNDAEYDRQTFADIAFIAAARTDIPALLADNAAKDQQIDELTEKLKKTAALGTKWADEILLKDEQIAILKRALELSIHDTSTTLDELSKNGKIKITKDATDEEQYQYYIHQAQEQEGQKCES